VRQTRQPERNAQPVNNPVKLRLTADVVNSHGDSRSALMHITDMLSLYPGDRDVLVYLPDGKAVRADANHRIEFTEELRAKLVRLLGSENVKG